MPKYRLYLFDEHHFRERAIDFEAHSDEEASNEIERLSAKPTVTSFELWCGNVMLRSSEEVD